MIPTTATTTAITTTTTPHHPPPQDATTPADPYASIAYLDALEDVHTRFVLNLPDSELQTADRIFFQLEQAWWFYEDWICDPRPELDLPRYANVRSFARMLFEYSNVLPGLDQFDEMWNTYSQYKRKISNYGCILMNKDMTKFVLCRVWNGKTHTFPAGKINQGERGRDAAARETYEGKQRRRKRKKNTYGGILLLFFYCIWIINCAHGNYFSSCCVCASPAKQNRDRV
jgi:hypothetical protein